MLLVCTMLNWLLCSAYCQREGLLLYSHIGGLPQTSMQSSYDFRVKRGSDLEKAISDRTIGLTSDNPAKESQFYETFYSDRLWRRTKFGAAAFSTVGTWNVKGNQICVTYEDKYLCRHIEIAASGNFVKMTTFKDNSAVSVYRLIRRAAK